MPVRKIALALFVSILFLVSACSSFASLGGPTATPAPTLTPIPISPSDPDFLVGLWRGFYGDADVAMTFDINGNVTIAVYGNLQAGTFTLDTSFKPHQLDMEFPDMGVITTIVEFVDANTIKVENVYPFISRPSIFKDYFLLTRSAK